MLYISIDTNNQVSVILNFLTFCYLSIYNQWYIQVVMSNAHQALDKFMKERELKRYLQVTERCEWTLIFEAKLNYNR